MFRQNFELDTQCKNTNTLFKRFSNKFPRAWEVWDEMFIYMKENNLDHVEEAGHYGYMRKMILNICA